MRANHAVDSLLRSMWLVALYTAARNVRSRSGLAALNSEIRDLDSCQFRLKLVAFPSLHIEPTLQLRARATAPMRGQGITSGLGRENVEHLLDAPFVAARAAHVCTARTCTADP